ncbi:NUDIX hydrolase [Paenibacillus solisilvae]|uniref:NUDIX hydrolase n=1 Tax=Paenibacillus solisilvae TaxID=2486751 RepID=A0ABW0W4X1_9BACL
MSPPKHIVSAAVVILNERSEILLIKGPRRGWEMPGGQVEEGESIKAAIEETLQMVTWKNFKQRIELCLDEAQQPFYVEF